VRCHARAAPIWLALFARWEQDDLLHLILTYDGCFVPRYKRDQAPPDTGGHPARRSVDVSALSNHSFGSAFDINAVDNGFGSVPALCGRRRDARAGRLGERARRVLGRPLRPAGWHALRDQQARRRIAARNDALASVRRSRTTVLEYEGLRLLARKG
jgi:hypothetical protein